MNHVHACLQKVPIDYVLQFWRHACTPVLCMLLVSGIHVARADPLAFDNDVVIESNATVRLDADVLGHLTVDGSVTAGGTQVQTDFPMVGDVSVWGNPGLYGSALLDLRMSANVFHTPFGLQTYTNFASAMLRLANTGVFEVYSRPISSTALSLRMVVDPEGRVGIGTSSPSATLDVEGDARFSGHVLIHPAGDLAMGEFTNGPMP